MSAALDPVTQTDTPCGNCGAVAPGPYCQQCGAYVAANRDLSLRRFASEAVEEVTNLDHSKLFSTVRALLFRPGLLTAEYFTDRRQRFLRPLTLVLAIFALSLFAFSADAAVSIFDSKRQASMEVSMAARAGGEPTANMLGARVSAWAKSHSMAEDSVYDEVDEAWARNTSLMQIPQIVLLALVLQLAFWRSRRHFVEHLVFSVHFFAFSVLTVVLLWPIYYLVGINFSTQAIAIALIKYAIDMTYLFLALRRFYGGTWRKTLIRVPILFVGYMLISAVAQATAMLLAIGSTLR